MSQPNRQPTGAPDKTAVSAPRGPFDFFGRLAVLSAVLLALSLAWFPLASIDLGYHLTYGRHFLDTGRIVGFSPDPFLRPDFATPFVNANWLSQMVMALVDRAAGLAGLFALRLLLVAIILGAVAIVALRAGGGALAVAVAIALAALGSYERFSLRPELFSYAILACQLAFLAGGLRSRRAVAGIVVLQLALVNLHSYFLLGLALTAVFAAPAFLREVAIRLRRSRGPSMGASGYDAHAIFLRRVAIALVLQAAACVVHPWHVRAAIFPLRTLAFLRSHDVMGGDAASEASAWSEINEFRSPFSFLDEPINRFTIDAYLLLLVVCGLGMIALIQARRLGPALAIALLFAVSLQMRRNIAPFALLSVPMAIGAMSAWLGRGLALATSFRAARTTFAAAVAVAGLAVAWSVVDGRFYYAERRLPRRFGTGYSANAFTMEAARWLREHDAAQPELFVDYYSSSNLLPWLPARYRLLCNTNTFAVRDEALRLSFDLVQGLAPHGPAFDRLGINTVLLRCSSDTQALVQALARDDMTWALVHMDRQSVVFVRRLPEHVDLILACEIKPGGVDTTAWIEAAEGGDNGSAGARSRWTRALDLYTQANVPMFLGWYDQAARHLAAAVKLAPDHAESWNNLGLCHAQMMNQRVRTGEFDAAMAHYEEARRAFEHALRHAPGHPVAAANLRRLKTSVRQ